MYATEVQTIGFHKHAKSVSLFFISSLSLFGWSFSFFFPLSTMGARGSVVG
jgi:hypothetical protein